MKLENAVAEIQERLRATEGTRRGRFHEVVDIVARFLVSSLVRDEEHGQVSILMLTRGSRQLTFVFPPELRSGNCFPVSPKSMAGQVVLTGKGVYSNNLPAQAHFGFYERVPGKDGSVHTIQKLMASPLSDEGKKVVGVVEASLTGRTPEEAGRDFTDEDMARLEKLSRIFGPFLTQAYPGEEIPQVLEGAPSGPKK